MTLSPDPRCFSTTIWAPDTSRIKLMLQPPRPITRLIADEGTCTFLDLQDTGLQDRWIIEHDCVKMLTKCSTCTITWWTYRLTTSFHPSSFFWPFFGLAITGVVFTWRPWTEGDTFSPFCLLTCNTWSLLSLKRHFIWWKKLLIVHLHFLKLVQFGMYLRFSFLHSFP